MSSEVLRDCEGAPYDAWRAACVTVVVFFVVVVFAGTLYAYKRRADDVNRRAADVSYIKYVLRASRTGLTPAEEGRLAHHITRHSRAYSLDPVFVLALIETESRYNNWSRSGKGAMGLMQILPETGEEVASDLSLEWNGAATLLDPYANVRLGIHYYSTLRTKFYNNTRRSLMAYNAGPVRAAQDASASRGFADRVMENYSRLKERAE